MSSGASSGIKVQLLVIATMVLADAITAALSLGIAMVTRIALSGVASFTDFEPVRNYTSLWPAITLLVAGRFLVGLYPGYGVHPADGLRRQTVATLSTALVVLGGGALFRFSEDYSRFVLVHTTGLLLILLPLARVGVKALLTKSGLYGFPVWLVGESDRASALAEALKESSLGLRVVGRGFEVPISAQVRHCLVVPEGLSAIDLTSLLDDLSRSFERVWLVPDLLDVASVWVTPRDLSGHLALELRNNLLLRRNTVMKRVLDLTITASLMPVALLVGIVIAIVVYLSGPGPIILRQQRVGRGSSRFWLLKFRTMEVGSDRVLAELLESDSIARFEWQQTRKLRNDPRVTRVGKFLRRTSLDELPQLYNVLKGEMSLVGPRPVMPDELDWYGSRAELYKRVAPGMTGLMQVSGRSNLDFEQRTHLDSYYVRNWSPWLDFVILGRTVGAVVTGRGAF